MAKQRPASMDTALKPGTSQPPQITLQSDAFAGARRQLHPNRRFHRDGR
jgi:hypothetical protein